MCRLFLWVRYDRKTPQTEQLLRRKSYSARVFSIQDGLLSKVPMAEASSEASPINPLGGKEKE